MKALLIDDEQHALEALKWELNEHCPEVEVVAATSDPMEAIRLIYALKPDLLFLDIEMPKMNGFELLQTLPEHELAIVFTTAYDEFAIKAIKVSAFDYLLKPIDSDELKATVQKFKQQMGASATPKLEGLLHSLSHEKHKLEKIPVPHQNGTDFIDQNTILYCESSGNYTQIHVQDTQLLISKTLKHFEQLLNPALFLRVHHSYIVNVNHVTKYIKGEGGELILSNGASIRVSRSRKESVLQKLKVIPAN